MLSIDINAYENTLPNPESEDGRRRLAKMVMRLFNLWQLAQTDQATLLGLSPRSRNSINRYKKGEPLNDNRDLLDRVYNLLGIHKALRILYPRNEQFRNRWISTPDSRIRGMAPIDIMRKEGLMGIVMIRHLLDGERGR